MLLACAMVLFFGAGFPVFGNEPDASDSKIDNPHRERILGSIREYLGVRYRLGGTSPNGFDCSGLVYYVYCKNGIRVPRTATEQYGVGKKVERERLAPGDLVFFSRRVSRRSIGHVGVYVGDNRFIHAPSFGLRVSYANMNDGYWRARYLGAVTFFVPWKAGGTDTNRFIGAPQVHANN